SELIEQYREFAGSVHPPHDGIQQETLGSSRRAYQQRMFFGDQRREHYVDLAVAFDKCVVHITPHGDELLLDTEPRLFRLLLHSGHCLLPLSVLIELIETKNGRRHASRIKAQPTCYNLSCFL